MMTICTYGRGFGAAKSWPGGYRGMRREAHEWRPEGERRPAALLGATSRRSSAELDGEVVGADSPRRASARAAVGDDRWRTS